MQNKTLIAAVLGGGINSAVGSAHYSAILLSNRFNIVAGAFSRNETTNTESAKVFKISSNRVYKDLTDLIKAEKGKIDCIIILTPTDQHVSQVLECLKSDIPVICEKALAGSVKETLEIKEQLEKSNGFLSVIYNYLGYPILRELKQMISNNNLGTIQQIQIEMPQEGFLKFNNGKPLTPQEWRLHDGQVSVLSLDLGVHLHMIIQYLTGETPLKVVSSSQSYGNFPGVIDNINCIIHYTNNIICNMWYSKVALGNRNGLCVRIFGSTGSAEWYQENSEIIKMANHSGHKWSIDRGSDGVTVCNQPRYTRFKVGHPAGFIEALANYYVDIANDLSKHLTNVSNDSKESFGVNESLEGLKLFESISKSAISESWQTV